MFNPEQTTNLLNDVTKPVSTNGSIHSTSIFRADDLSSNVNPFQNAAIYSSSSNYHNLGEGDHIATTGSGDDLILLSSGNDFLNAGDGNNIIYSGDGIKFIKAGSGNDFILAGSGNNVIYSGAGNDTIYLGGGNNFISTGIGNDVVHVGNGNNRFELSSGGSVTIFGFDSNDTIRLNDGFNPSVLSFMVEGGDTLIKAGNDLLATLKSIKLTSVVSDNSPIPISPPALLTGGDDFITGVFTVGDTGQVGVDYLFDGGAYEGELAFFSLTNLNYELGSSDFIKEAARRALSDSSLGHIVISDRTEGARFHGNLNEADFNSGVYESIKTVSMQSGDQFGIMLVPNGTVQQIFNNDLGSEKLPHPLFSVETFKPQDLRYVGQTVDITGSGNVFAMEDLSITGQSDRDYNDMIFQVRGATGSAVTLDQLLAAGVVSPQQDWRTSDLGQALVNYAKPYSLPNQPAIGETVSNRVLNILDQAANQLPSKGKSVALDGFNPNQALIVNWGKTATEKLSNLDKEGQSEIDGLGSTLINSQDYLYNQISALGFTLSSDQSSLNGQLDDLAKQLFSSDQYAIDQINELGKDIANTNNYLYAWADYTAKTINNTVDWLNEWTDYASSEINRINSRLIDQTNFVSNVLGSENQDYKNLVSDRQAVFNSAFADYLNIGGSKNQAVSNAETLFRSWDDYRVQLIDNAWSQHSQLDNERSATITDAYKQKATLERYVNVVMNTAWNRYQEIDNTRLQALNNAWNQYSFLTRAWNNWIGDAKDQIDVWSKIAASQNGWYTNNQSDVEQKAGLPLIGIIDTGFRADDPDIDYSRVSLGKDRVNNDLNPLLEPWELGASSHGTQTLETIAATRNNGIGIDGINDRSPLWLGRAVGSNDWAQALVEFVDAAIASKQPNAVVNLSFDLTQTSADGTVSTRYELTPLERAALTYAQQNNVLIVAASGNQDDLTSALGQASKEFDNILTVGAAEGSSRASYSSYNPSDLAHYGKGVDILAQGRTENGSFGTSIAAAKVIGAVSLVWAANPGLNYTQAIDILKRTATDLNTPGWDAETGLGLLNISAAVDLAKATQPQPYKPLYLDAIQDILKQEGVSEANWADFYQVAYYKDLEAKLTGKSWSATQDTLAGEREAYSLKALGQDLSNGAKTVGSVVKQIFTRPETKFVGGDPNKDYRGSSNSGINILAGLPSGVRDVISQGGNSLKATIRDTSQAVQKGKNILTTAQDKFSSEIRSGAAEVNSQLQVYRSAIATTNEVVRNATRNATSSIVQTSNQIGDSLNTYSDRISNEAQYVGNQAQTVTNKLEKLYDDNQQALILINPALVIGTKIGKGLIDGVKEGNVGPVLDVLERVPVLGTAVNGLEGLYYAAKGDWRDVLKKSIDSALAFYGVNNTPGLGEKFIGLYVDVSWELKDKNYKGAIAAALNDFGVNDTYKDLAGKERRIADVFVASAWAFKDGNWRDVLDTGLSKAGFSNANKFVDIAWGVKDANYQKALTTGLQVAGLDHLSINQQKADAFVSSAFALRDGHADQVADQLLAIAGGNAQQFAASAWVQALRNDNPNDDREALSQGLSAVGFQNTNQWVDIAWDVKDNRYLDALSTGFSLGGFQQGKDWVDMVGSLQKDDYLNALTIGFKEAGFEQGDHLAKAALALRQGDPINAFYEGLSLVDGVRELVDAFKYLKDGNAQKAVPLMRKAAPKLAEKLPELLK